MAECPGATEDPGSQAQAASENHNNQNVNTTNSEPQQGRQQQQILLVTTNGSEGGVDVRAEEAETGEHEQQRTVIVHEEVLKQVRRLGRMGRVKGAAAVMADKHAYVTKGQSAESRRNGA